MRTGQTIALLLPLTVLAASAARAEISVTLDGTGHVTSLNVVSDPIAGRIWSPATGLPSDQLLNSTGDTSGDGSPTGSVIGMPMDDPMRTPHVASGSGAGGVAPRIESIPVVVWSRSDGWDSEIVYSVWDPTARRWRVPIFVERIDNFDEDVVPRVAVCDRTVYLSWTRVGAEPPLVFVRGSLEKVGASYDVVWGTPSPATAGTLVLGPYDSLVTVSSLFTGNLCPPPAGTATDGFAQGSSQR